MSNPYLHVFLTPQEQQVITFMSFDRDPAAHQIGHFVKSGRAQQISRDHLGHLMSALRGPAPAFADIILH